MTARLTRALAEGERYTPDADAVLAGVRAGIARARRRRRYTAAGLAAFTVLALSGTAVVVGRSELSSPRPAGSATPPAVPAQECRLSFGWLPEGLAEPSRNCGPRRQSVLYPITGGPYLAVSIDQSGWQGPAKITPGWKPTTVNGRTGQIVTRRTRAFVQFPLPSGHWVDIEYGGGKGAPELEATARRIAEHISETPAGSLTAPFTPTYLPAGQRLAFVGQRRGSEFNVAYQDGSGRIIGSSGTATTQDGVIVDEIEIDSGTEYHISWRSDLGNDDPTALGERIGNIQGHPAYLLNGGSLLTIEGFHGGELSVAANLPIDERGRPRSAPAGLTSVLIRIAEGVRWPG
ncbi:hypothetical protein ONA70_24060 [Micromonospora yasonensis]|uniref:hypothetical protein n=1 Tax=Micromonospora yasonensis TaxID=1128667 RepID=UPI0022317875|nr:hypothetical protein [Micromonospora yasonensis]MCW3843181.1 hypothetical protein [Micromonospora yasonensis]